MTDDAVQKDTLFCEFQPRLAYEEYKNKGQ